MIIYQHTTKRHRDVKTGRFVPKAEVERLLDSGRLHGPYSEQTVTGQYITVYHDRVEPKFSGYIVGELRRLDYYTLQAIALELGITPDSNASVDALVEAITC